jgi:hypothetical protein
LRLSVPACSIGLDIRGGLSEVYAVCVAMLLSEIRSQSQCLQEVGSKIDYRLLERDRGGGVLTIDGVRQPYYQPCLK